MNDDDQGRRDLDAAAEILSATRAVDDAIADLAARPLDEAAADRMRMVLADADLVQARAALRRLTAVARPRRQPRRLTVVSPPAEPDAEESDRAVGLVGGVA